MGVPVTRLQKSVFLSYRRADFGWAIAIYQALTERGFDVFIDFEGLGPGNFEHAILENIATRAHFLVLLTPAALEHRAGAREDWLRREIEAALDCDRNVVPLMVEGFSFSDETTERQLTGRLALLRQANALPITKPYFFAAMDRLERFLRRTVKATGRKPSGAAADIACRQQRAADAVPVTQGRPAGSIDVPASLVWPARLVVRQMGARLEFELTGPTPDAAVSAAQPFQAEIVAPLITHATGGSMSSAERHALFQLLVPRALRPALRSVTHLMLDTDKQAGLLPWEQLQPDPPRDGDAGLPLGAQAGIVRRLVGPPKPAVAADPHVRDTALIVANPSTDGFERAFQGFGEFPPLPGAAAEGQAVSALLHRGGFGVTQTSDGADAREVVTRLHSGPWRILHIAGHGVVDVVHKDGSRRTGVVLANGALLMASDVAALEVPPELVVFTCEHFGSLRVGSAADGGGSTLVETLLDAGVRCLVVPAGAVNDDAARHFSEVLYDHLVRCGDDFGVAVWAARRALWERQANDFTFASLHAYGDPSWRVRRQ